MMNDSKLEAIFSKVYKHGGKTEHESKAKAPSKRTHFNRDDHDADSEPDDSFGSHHFMTDEPLHHDSDSDKTGDDSVSACSLHPMQNLQPQKRGKHKHCSADVVAEMENTSGNRVPIHALSNTGTTATVILRPFVKQGRITSYKKDQMRWNTMGGTFLTKCKAKMDFKFPELNNKTVTWSCHVDDTHKPNETSHDMIIGLDLMVDIHIFVNTATLTVDWGEHSAPLKPRGSLRI